MYKFLKYSKFEKIYKINKFVKILYKIEDFYKKITFSRKSKILSMFCNDFP